MENSISRFPLSEKDRLLLSRSPVMRGNKPHKPPYQGVVPVGRKYCPDCEEVRELPLFVSRTGNLYGYCQDCRNRRQRERHDKNKGRMQSLKRNYGMTQEEYEKRLKQQGGVCAICGGSETRRDRTGIVHSLVVDHDHKHRRVRSLLCSNCNLALGASDEDITRLRNMIAYIEKWKM